MSYVALKSVKFDRLYQTGEAIPEDVIDPKRVGRLIDSGKIVPHGTSAAEHSDSVTELEAVSKALETEVANHAKTSEKLAKEKETTKKLKAEVKVLKAEISAFPQVEEDVEAETEDEVEEIFPDNDNIQSFEDVLQEIENEEDTEEELEEEVGDGD